MVCALRRSEDRDQAAITRALSPVKPDRLLSVAGGNVPPAERDGCSRAHSVARARGYRESDGSWLLRARDKGHATTPNWLTVVW